jgi:lantibiotic modifying enzyme
MVDWLDEATGIGESLHRAAIVLPGGALTWPKPSAAESQDRSKTLGPHLYNGSSGVALFFAALFRASGDEQHREVARKALLIPRRQLASLIAAPEADGSQIKLGGMVGLGSLLYSFLRIGTWLEDPRLIEEACNIAGLVSPERIEADVSLDVMYGTAGAILSLLALEREAPAELGSRARLLERASACGDSLLRKRTFQEEEFGGWPAGNRAPCAGFAHGAAGISRALAALGARTGRAELWQAAQDGFLFERRFYFPERKNWQCSPTDSEISMVAWCNGAPGIALGRLGLPQAHRSDEIRGEIETALETTSTAPDSLFDFLCCGNLGRADILVQAFHDLKRSDLLDQAREIASRAIQRAKSQGGPSAFSAGSGRPCGPGFFRGLSGIGYTLLRLSGEVALPCVLALE